MGSVKDNIWEGIFLYIPVINKKRGNDNARIYTTDRQIINAADRYFAGCSITAPSRAA
jgi:hypothetical protein